VANKAVSWSSVWF